MVEHQHVWRGATDKRCACGASPKEECQAGHPRTLENAYQNARGVWVCRVCQRDRVASWRDTQMTADQHAKIKKRNLASQKILYTNRKKSVLDHYGWACACCGETVVAFLCIDHVNGGGNKHREELTG